MDESISHGQSYLDSAGTSAPARCPARAPRLKTEEGTPWVIPADSFTDFGFIPEIAGFGVAGHAVTACHMDKSEIGQPDPLESWDASSRGQEPVKYRLAQTGPTLPQLGPHSWRLRVASELKLPAGFRPAAPSRGSWRAGAGSAVAHGG